MIRLVGYLMSLDEGEVLFYTTMSSYSDVGNRRPPTGHPELQGCLKLSMTPEFKQTFFQLWPDHSSIFSKKEGPSIARADLNKVSIHQIHCSNEEEHHCGLQQLRAQACDHQNRQRTRFVSTEK